MSEKIQAQLTIAATPKAVFQALTQGDELTKWFAEYVDISWPEKHYDFWGALPQKYPIESAGVMHCLL